MPSDRSGDGSESVDVVSRSRLAGVSFGTGLSIGLLIGMFIGGMIL